MASAESRVSAVDCDAVFEALANVYRRRLLMLLLERAPERGGVQLPEEVHSGQKAMAVLQAEMFHKHLPKLEELGFVQWDQSTDRAVRGPTFDEIRPVLELLNANQDELPRNWLD